MSPEVVYDLVDASMKSNTDDAIFSTIFYGIAIVFLLLILFLTRYMKKMRWLRTWYKIGMLLSISLLTVSAVVDFMKVKSDIRDYRCWLDNGYYETVEGNVTQIRHDEKSHNTLFNIGDTTFEIGNLSNPMLMFRWEDILQKGYLRIHHHDGTILRIESCQAKASNDLQGGKINLD